MQADKRSNIKKYIADLFVVLLFLLAGLSVYFILELTESAGASVSVTVGGELEGEYSLSINGEYDICGGKSTLVIENREAYLINSDCPDKLCEHMRKISRSGERIVCLPNKLYVVVNGGEEIVTP